MTAPTPATLNNTNPQADGLRPWTAPAQPAGDLTEPQEAAKWARLRLRHFTAAGNGVNLAVGAGASTLAVTFKRVEPNATYGVTITPAWGTTVWVTNRATTGFTANFGTVAPGGGSTMSFTTFRSEDA